MKIKPRYFPLIILTTFVLFVLLGIALGFRPQHGGGGGHRSILEGLQYTLLFLGGLG